MPREIHAQDLTLGEYLVLRHLHSIGADTAQGVVQHNKRIRNVDNVLNSLKRMKLVEFSIEQKGAEPDYYATNLGQELVQSFRNNLGINRL